MQENEWGEPDDIEVKLSTNFPEPGASWGTIEYVEVWHTCRRCRGRGRTWFALRECPKCHGSGAIIVISREVVLDVRNPANSDRGHDRDCAAAS